MKVTPALTNSLLSGEKLIFAVVSGTFEIQTSIFMRLLKRMRTDRSECVETGTRLTFLYVHLLRRAKINIKKIPTMTDGNRLAALRALLEEQPGDPFLHYAIGLEHLKMSDLASARASFSGLVTANPDYLPAYFQLGKVLEQLNETELAVQAYEQGISLASSQRNSHTLSELRGALQSLSGEADD